MRKKRNRVTLAYFLVDFFVETKILAREFSVIAEIESKLFKCSILDDLKNDTWPTNCLAKRKVIKDYFKNKQNQILISKKEQQLSLIAVYVFDIRNRISAIDTVFNGSKSSNYNQVGYSDFTCGISFYFIF